MLRIYQQYSNGNVFFNLVETSRSDAVNHVLRGQVDLAFAVRTSVDSKDIPWNRESSRLTGYTIDSKQSYIAVGPSSVFYNRKSVSMSDLTDCLQIALDMEEEAKQSYWLERSKYNGFNNNRIIFVNSVAACATMLLETDAISFCSHWTRGCYADKTIRIIPIIDSNCRYDLIMLYRKGEALTFAEADFAAAVFRKFGKAVPAYIAQFCSTP